MRRLLASLCLPACALVLAACGTTPATSTSAFSGTKRAVAERIASFQSDASSSEEKKICANDLAAALIARLGGVKGCEAALKAQLGEVDNPELAIESVQLAADGKSATATVKGVREGKSSPGKLQLVKEAAGWRISGL
ncbi:MAG TPA: hypothetical protein VMD79_14655 [Solirubrobacteraceae bacterium]|nr:hypothetical protein [Solirubrobacteraceae bacterium]